MTVSIAIQAVLEREELAEALRASLPGSEIVWDPNPTSVIRSPWRTYQHALRTTPAGATHRLVVQDDTVASPHLVEVLPRIAASHPDVAVTLFVAGAPRHFYKRVVDACREDRIYAELPTRPWVPVVATMYPITLIERLLDWTDAQDYPDHFVSDDEIMGRAMRGVDGRLFATVPSLIDHPDVVESTLGRNRNFAGRSTSRVAACFLDEDLDCRDYDW